MNIPEEATEAAANAIGEVNAKDRMSSSMTNLDFLLAQAWDQGFLDGRRQDAEGEDAPQFLNPYRSPA